MKNSFATFTINKIYIWNVNISLYRRSIKIMVYEKIATILNSSLQPVQYKKDDKIYVIEKNNLIKYFCKLKSFRITLQIKHNKIQILH